ncbi:hypothetical protein PCANC_13494 [Puccinia coronata f. sp. avenae]|uniref:Uncharacterized protein n=1 Tax=Puccinia coronata f. sp. avenae TaxID=200324 RepID=A0A2N5V4L4_9BASI|nr:hypothetical protein PCANC_13494 [Puccinia coronata f. sp. avenae]
MVILLRLIAVPFTNTFSHLLEFQELLIKVQQKHINFKELLGLILQSIVKPPILANKNSFQNNLNHRLNTSLNILSFNRMCKEITQVEGELTTGTLPSNPISINCTQPGFEHGCSSGAQTAVFDRWSDGHCPTKARANWLDRFVQPVPAGPVQPVPGTDRTGLSDPPAGALVGQCLSNYRSNTAVRAPLELPCLTDNGGNIFGLGPNFN